MRILQHISVLAGFAAAAVGQVLVVEPNGGGDFRTIQDAVLAAPDGATILIRAGVYTEAVVINGKGLALLGDGGVRIHGASLGRTYLTVQNHPANARTAIARIRIGEDVEQNTGVAGLEIARGEGEVHLDDVVLTRPMRGSSFNGRIVATRCSIRPLTATSQPHVALPAVSLTDVRHVTLSACALTGGTGVGDFSNPTPGLPALRAARCTLELVRPLFSGGPGGMFPRGMGFIEGDGGNGIELTACTARLLGAPGSAVRGATPVHFTFSQPAGGAGVVLVGSSLEHSSVAIQGGGGLVPGPALRADAASTVVALPPVATMGRDSAWRLGQVTVLDVAGAADAPGAFVLATNAASVPTPWGPLLVEPTSILITVPFVLNGAGAWQLPVRLPVVPEALGLSLLAQPATVDAALQLTLGGPNGGVVLW